MEYTFTSAILLLFLILDPFGNFPIFSSILKNYSVSSRRWIIVREHIIAFCILLGFMLTGDWLLKVMGLSNPSLQIAGGVILFLIAIRMVFPPANAGEEVLEHEPLVVPLAIPLIAGPSSLATVMLLVNQQPSEVFSWVGVLAITVLLSATVLLVLDRIQKLLGSSFIVAMEKLMGLILVALSIEMLIRGVKGAL